MKIQTLLTVAAAAIFLVAAKPLQHGYASYYGNEFVGRKTASGQIYTHNKMTAAHRTLKFGTRVRVSTGKRSVTVTINDRGPFIKGRVIDLSRSAAKALGIINQGVAKVTVEVL